MTQVKINLTLVCQSILKCFLDTTEDSLSPRKTNKHAKLTTDGVTSSKMGRTQALVWEHFDTKKDGKKIISNTCKNCKKSVSAKPTRMQSHLQKCIKKCARPEAAQLPASSSIDATLSTKPLTFPSSATASKQSKMTGFVKSMNRKAQDEIALQLGRFIFSANLSFNTVENPEFKKFVNMLEPSFVIPSHEVLGSTILDKVYQEICTERAEMLKDKKCMLVQDGWSTNQNDPVIAHCLSNPESTHFLSAENVGSSTKSGEFCFDLFQKAKGEATENLKVDVIGLVTDNCSSMVVMQNLVKQKYPEMEAYGCNAHLFNLLGQKFTPKDLMEKVSFVQNYMRNHHKPSAMLKELKGNRPAKPGDTRWNSQIDGFKNYCQNHTKYLEIARNLTPTTANDKHQLVKLREMLNDSNIYDDLKSTISVLEPISKSLDKVSTGTQLSHGYTLNCKLIFVAGTKEQCNFGGFNTLLD